MIYEMDPILDYLTLTWTETEQISGETNQIIESETEIRWKHFIRGHIRIDFKSQLA